MTYQDERNFLTRERATQYNGKTYEHKFGGEWITVYDFDPYADESPVYAFNRRDPERMFFIPEEEFLRDYKECEEE